MAVKFEAKAKVGTYKNQAGEDKPNWVRVGTVFETSNGLSMKMDSVPVGFDGWISFFIPKPKQAGGQPQNQSANTIEDDENIPF